MSLEPGPLLASLLVSSIGFVLLAYGRKMSRPPHVLTGIVLLVYPYFVPSAWITMVIGGFLLLLLWLAVRQGF